MLNMSMALIKNPEFIGTQIDGEFVLMSIESGKYYLIKNSGTSILECFEAPSTVESVVTRILAEYEVSNDECSNEVSAFVNDLYGKRILIDAASTACAE